MSRVDTLALAALLAGGQADEVVLEREYDLVVTELADQPIITQATIVPVVRGEPVVDFPRPAVQLLGLIHDDTWLSLTSVRTLVQTHGAHWRTRTGKPTSYVLDDVSARQVRLYPVPNMTSDPVIATTGAPFGLDFPRNALVFLHTVRLPVFAEEFRDLPPWCDAWIAFSICARLFHYESAVRDPEMAAACARWAGLLAQMTLGSA